MASFTLGLDLAIVRDNSAAVLVERFIRHAGSLRPNGDPQTVSHSRVQGIWRFERGTPFTTVLEEVGGILQASPLRRSCLLVYDKTGLGNAVAESVDRAYVAGKLGAWRPRGLTQTAGLESKGWNVPKRDLVSEVAVALQERRLEISPKLPLARKLAQELEDFRVRITAAGNDRFEAATESAHDDLVSALSMACWAGRHGGIGIASLMGADGTIIVR